MLWGRFCLIKLWSWTIERRGGVMEENEEMRETEEMETQGRGREEEKFPDETETERRRRTKDSTSVRRSLELDGNRTCWRYQKESVKL
jgi:hypothetical protein